MPMPRRHFDRPCATCGRSFGPRSTLQRFCSRPCSDAAHVKPREVCTVCRVQPRKLGFKTCGAACGYELRKSAVKPRPCQVCGTSFRPAPNRAAIGQGKFCSAICHKAWMAERHALIQVACATCGEVFRRTRAAVARVRAAYCSLRCSAIGNSGEGSANWRGGSDPNRGQKWRAIAESVRVRDGHRCRRCGKTQAEEGQRLSVDHVIPWRSFTDEAAANDPSNLVALCRSCHARKARAERLWLKGDVLDMWRYQVAVAQPWREGDSCDHVDPVFGCSACRRRADPLTVGQG